MGDDEALQLHTLVCVFLTDVKKMKWRQRRVQDKRLMAARIWIPS